MAQRCVLSHHEGTEEPASLLLEQVSEDACHRPMTAQLLEPQRGGRPGPTEPGAGEASIAGPTWAWTREGQVFPTAPSEQLSGVSYCYFSMLSGIISIFYMLLYPTYLGV